MTNPTPPTPLYDAPRTAQALRTDVDRSVRRLKDEARALARANLENLGLVDLTSFFRMHPFVLIENEELSNPPLLPRRFASLRCAVQSGGPEAHIIDETDANKMGATGVGDKVDRRNVWKAWREMETTRVEPR